MSPFPLCCDASVGGAIVSASLAAPALPAPDAAVAVFDLAKPAAAPLPALPRARRRGFGALVDLVSGPEPVRA